MPDQPWSSVAGAEETWRTGDRSIALRVARDADAAALFACRERPISQRFISRIPRSLQECRDSIGAQRQDRLAVRCAIVVDSAVVGDIGGRFYRPGSLGPEPEGWDFHLGYCVHPDLWGRGIGSASVGLFTPLLHERFGIRRIVAKVFEGNHASARVLAKCGYRLEATEIAAVLGRDGSWLNDCTFAHLA